MRRVLCCGGMETHLSLMLLVSASLLITAFSISIGQNERKDQDLFDLRTFQAGCILSCVRMYGTDEARGTFVQQLTDEELPICIIWNGTDALMIEGCTLEKHSPLVEVLAWTPDGLGCLVLIEHPDEQTIDINGSVVVQKASIDEEKVLTVALPLFRGGAYYRGVAF